MDCPVCNQPLVQDWTKMYHYCEERVEFYSCYNLPHYEQGVSTITLVIYPYILLTYCKTNITFIRKFHPPTEKDYQFSPYTFCSTIGNFPTSLFFKLTSTINLQDVETKIKRLEKIKIFT
jgi:hypothetical protein